MEEPTSNGCPFCKNYIFCIHDTWGNILPEWSGKSTEPGWEGKSKAEEFFSTNKYLRNKATFTPRCPEEYTHAVNGWMGDECKLCNPPNCSDCAGKLIKLQGGDKEPFMGCSNFKTTGCPFKRRFVKADEQELNEDIPKIVEKRTDMKNKMTELIEDAVIIPKQTFELLLNEKNGSRLIALYGTYYWVAKWQKTNQPWATGIYASKKLGWSRQTVCKYNKALKKLGLIEDVQPRDSKTGKLKKRFIKVKFIITKASIYRSTA